MHAGAYDGTRGLLELLERDRSISGVFADNDIIAMGCLKACARLGLRVPQDLSLVSVGGFYYNEMLPKQITTYAIDYSTMSRYAVDFLYDDVQGRERESSAGEAPSPAKRTDPSDSRPHPELAVPVESVALEFVPGATLGTYQMN